MLFPHCLRVKRTSKNFDLVCQSAFENPRSCTIRSAAKIWNFSILAIPPAKKSSSPIDTTSGASMVAMAKKPARKRFVVFVTLDEPTERALQKFLDAQRIPPERSAVGFTAIVEFLKREGYAPE